MNTFRIIQWALEFTLANMDDPEVEEMFVESTGADVDELVELVEGRNSSNG
jgi:hypothetical protein